MDLHNINQLHHHVHGVDGMLGSLDCSHTIWKIDQRHGQVPIKEQKTTPPWCWRVFLIITCFWHASYGYAGTLNSKTIFNLSPFQEHPLDGSFEEKELLSGVMAFSIIGEKFNKISVLVDGIYINFLRFVKGINMIDKKINEVYNGKRPCRRISRGSLVT
ncbi:hypothetical protein ACHAW6_008245 [Cyclotella cf. meneghiniana]